MTRRAWIAGLLLLGVLAAGCIGGEETNAGGLRLGTDSGLPTDPRTDATLTAPPAWRLGEWWRIDFSAPPYGIHADVTAVVVGRDGDRYLVGMADALDEGVLLLHFPGFGEIEPATLGFDAHDRPFVPLQFPLTAGASWETQWYNGIPLDASVTSVGESSATVTLTGAREIVLEYDAVEGAISSMLIDGYGGFQVAEHGYGYEGTVVVPAGQDLVFCHGRAMVVQAIELCETLDATSPRPPTQSVELAAGYDRVSFGLFMRDTEEAPVAPGVLHIEVTDPKGGTYSATKTPDQPGMLLDPYSLDDPEGTWEITAVAGGAGLAILEGVAYRVVEVTL